MDQKTSVLIPKYETIVIPQEEIDKIVSPDDFIPMNPIHKKKRLLKKVVRYMRCPTCGVVTGHRRKAGTINTFDCCVCGHSLPLIHMESVGLLLYGGGLIALLAAIAWILITFIGEWLGMLPLVIIGAAAMMVMMRFITSC